VKETFKVFQNGRDVVDWPKKEESDFKTTSKWQLQLHLYQHRERLKPFISIFFLIFYWNSFWYFRKVYSTVNKIFWILFLFQNIF